MNNGMRLAGVILVLLLATASRSPVLRTPILLTAHRCGFDDIQTTCDTSPRLVLDLTYLPERLSYRAELVNTRNHRLAAAAIRPGAAAIFDPGPLSKGQYFARVWDGPELLREYSLIVSTSRHATACPANGWSAESLLR